MNLCEQNDKKKSPKKIIWTKSSVKTNIIIDDLNENKKWNCVNINRFKID